jgi:signal transduction histidine kinase
LYNTYKNKYYFNNDEYFFIVLDIEGIMSILNIIQNIIFGIYYNLKIKNCFILVFLIFTIFSFISNITTIIIVIFYFSNKVNLIFYILSILKEILYLINIIFISLILKNKNNFKKEKVILKTDNLSEKIFQALSKQQQKLLEEKNENLIDFSNINIHSEDFSITNSLEKSN